MTQEIRTGGPDRISRGHDPDRENGKAHTGVLE
jgi:hypothetical protein